MRIGILGAGAIGSIVGGLLTKAGHDVTLIDQWPDHVEAMKRVGLRLSGSCGEHMRWPDLLQRNQWYCIEARVRLNTISGGRGNNDGVLQGWIDERLVFNRSNLRFRDLGTLKIEKLWGNIYVGGSWTADRAMAIHFDNAVIARNRIGCAN